MASRSVTGSAKPTTTKSPASKAATGKTGTVKATSSIVELPVKPKVTEEKPAARPKKTTVSKPNPPAVSAEERERMIREAAYYIAERRGFVGGSAAEDWEQAVAEVDQLLKGGKQRRSAG